MVRWIRLSSLATVFVAACSSSSSVIGGGDDGGNDATTPDATAPDAAPFDAGPPPDAGTDAHVGDAGPDAPQDAAIDNDPRCPPSYGATGDCTSEIGLTCRYAQGRCDCERPCSGVFIPDASWSCTPAVPDCPANPPEAGAACSANGTHCVYPGCCTQNDFTCSGGSWDAAAPFCPP